MTDAERELFANRAWLVEVYHRALKQFTGIKRGQFRLERSQRNHIGLALRAYIRLEFHRWRTRVSSVPASSTSFVLLFASTLLIPLA